MSDDLNISITRQAVKAFLKATLNEPVYRFEVEGSTEDAAKFVQRMRVDLSRIRADLEFRGINVAPFKVMRKDMVYNRETNRTLVTLEKRVEKYSNIFREVQDVIKELTGDNT